MSVVVEALKLSLAIYLSLWLEGRGIGSLEGGLVGAPLRSSFGSVSIGEAIALETLVLLELLVLIV